MDRKSVAVVPSFVFLGDVITKDGLCDNGIVSNLVVVVDLFNIKMGFVCT